MRPVEEFAAAALTSPSLMRSEVRSATIRAKTWKCGDAI